LVVRCAPRIFKAVGANWPGPPDRPGNAPGPILSPDDQAPEGPPDILQILDIHEVDLDPDVRFMTYAIEREGERFVALEGDFLWNAALPVLDSFLILPIADLNRILELLDLRMRHVSGSTIHIGRSLTRKEVRLLDATFTLPVVFCGLEETDENDTFWYGLVRIDGPTTPEYKMALRPKG